MDHHVHAVVIHIPTSFQEECIGLLQGMSPEEGEVLVRMGAHGVQILREGNITRDVSDLRIEYERKLSNKDQERQMWQEVFTNHQASVLNERVQQFQVEMERYKQRLEASERDRMALERAHIQTVEEEKNKVLTKYEALSHQQQEEWKQLHERWIIAQAELTCSKDTVDLLVRTRVHEVVEERRQDHSRHIEELTTLVETYRTKCQEMEVREQATKVEALHLAMEEQKKEVQEIKATLGAKNRQSSATLGKEGEAYFYELAERTFATYDDFEMENKTKVGHSGDFHLKFKDFSVLADTKHFLVGKISTTDVTKFKYDMSRNQSIRVGWLISLNGHISNYSKRPYAFEVVDGRLLVFINDLKHAENPGKMLEDIYYMSNFLYHEMLNVESNTEVLKNYQRYEKRIKENMIQLHKVSKKTIASMNQLRDDVLDTEKFIVNMINEDMMNVRNEHSTLVQEWWGEHVVAHSGAKIKSSALYEHFTGIHATTSIKSDMFKSVLKAMLQEDQLHFPKTEKSPWTILGFRLKN